MRNGVRIPITIDERKYDVLILPRTDVLAAKDELFRQLKTGALDAHEYEFAFEQLNAAHSHDQRCANGDRRPVIVVIDDKALCGRCAHAHYEVHG